jgi:hypothetical protein
MPVQDGETGRIDAGGLNAVAGQLQAGLNGLPAGSGLQNPVVTSGLPELLSGLATALVVARSQLDSDTAGQIMRLLRSIVHDEGTPRSSQLTTPA